MCIFALSSPHNLQLLLLHPIISCLVLNETRSNSKKIAVLKRKAILHRGRVVSITPREAKCTAIYTKHSI